MGAHGDPGSSLALGRAQLLPPRPPLPRPAGSPSLSLIPPTFPGVQIRARPSKPTTAPRTKSKFRVQRSRPQDLAPPPPPCRAGSSGQDSLPRAPDPLAAVFPLATQVPCSLHPESALRVAASKATPPRGTATETPQVPSFCHLPFHAVCT